MQEWLELFTWIGGMVTVLIVGYFFWQLYNMIWSIFWHAQKIDSRLKEYDGDWCKRQAEKHDNRIFWK